MSDVSENSTVWIIVVLTIIACLLVSVITSSLVVRDKINEYAIEQTNVIELLQTRIDSLNIVIAENKELPVFEIMITPKPLKNGLVELKRDTILIPTKQ